MAEPTIESANHMLKLSAHFRRIANAPLKRQDSSDAWNERQNRLAASRDSLRLLIRGTMELNQAKRKANGAGPT
jgi:hypothetical protein